MSESTPLPAGPRVRTTAPAELENWERNLDWKPPEFKSEDEFLWVYIHTADFVFNDWVCWAQRQHFLPKFFMLGRLNFFGLYQLRRMLSQEVPAAPILSLPYMVGAEKNLCQVSSEHVPDPAVTVAETLASIDAFFAKYPFLGPAYPVELIPFSRMPFSTDVVYKPLTFVKDVQWIFQGRAFCPDHATFPFADSVKFVERHILALYLAAQTAKLKPTHIIEEF